MSDQHYQEWMQVPVAEYRALEAQLAEALSQRQAAVEEAERLRVALLGYDVYPSPAIEAHESRLASQPPAEAEGA